MNIAEVIWATNKRGQSLHAFAEDGLCNWTFATHSEPLYMDFGKDHKIKGIIGFIGGHKYSRRPKATIV